MNTSKQKNIVKKLMLTFFNYKYTIKHFITNEITDFWLLRNIV